MAARSSASASIRPTSWISGSNACKTALTSALSFNTPFNESHGKVSSDNRWIAYDTDASGKNEVWVASFPSGAARRQVSVGGGRSPAWGEGSKEIFYISDDHRLMAAPFSAVPDHCRRRHAAGLVPHRELCRDRPVGFRDDQRLRRRVEWPAVPCGRQSPGSQSAADQHHRQLACPVEPLRRPGALDISFGAPPTPCRLWPPGRSPRLPARAIEAPWTERWQTTRSTLNSFRPHLVRPASARLANYPSIFKASVGSNPKNTARRHDGG